MIKKLFVIVILLGLSVGGGFAYYANQLVEPQISPHVSRFAPLIQASDPLPTPSELMKISPGDPVRLLIPKINVDSIIEPVGLDQNRRMGVPKDWFNAGWFMHGPKPGEIGAAVIDGHLDTPTGPSIFWRLHELQPGDVIQVIDTKQISYTFQVTDKATYPDSQFPINLVFGQSADSSLHLITCSGVYSRSQRNYSDRLVIFTKLLQ